MMTSQTTFNALRKFSIAMALELGTDGKTTVRGKRFRVSMIVSEFNQKC